jgi:rubrerythrin
MFTRINFAKLTLMDALDLASLIEVEAHERYKLFAAQLGQRDPSDAGSVFQSMAANEKKHGDQLAKRRKTHFGDTPAKVTVDDIFDVEAPDVGSPRWNMSALKAFQVALAAEKKAFAFYDQALPSVTQPDVKALFEELRDEESEHVRMLEEIIAKLPPEAAIELDDADTE